MDPNYDVNMTPAIEFQHVSISFGELQVLSDVSFALRPNEMLFVTGASGSGKSVMLRLAMGMLRPDAGQIYIQGREITALEEEEILDIRGKQLGLVFQDEALFTDRDVYDNAAYRLVEHDWPLDKVDVAVREVLGFVGLDQDLEKEVFELSGGMKRRLELARAIIGWPQVMLFDEPTTGLDPINSQQVRDMVIRARDLHQMSSIYVSKAMHEIKYLVTHFARRDDHNKIEILEADTTRRARTRVLVLDEGRIDFLGSYDQFCESPLPAIIRLLRPQPSSIAANPDFHPLDPWSKEGRPAHEIL
jgi:phospholipid/cholesterol/gamma-HCH transport system ATP-binding protein